MNIIKPGETVMVFTSKEKEVNTKPLILALFEKKNPVVVPIIVKEDVSLRLSYLQDFSALVPSTFGVPEPIGSEIPADAKDIDTIILPMLGFDRAGGRIGYGAGYYDRFLSKNPNLQKIGIAFACQEFDGLPVDENDIRMDYIITEDGIVYHGLRRTEMEINGTEILDTFAEAFPIWLSRVIITAATPGVGVPCRR